MTGRKYLCCVVTLALSALPSSAWAGGGTADRLPAQMTLQDAVDYALAHHPNARVEYANEEAAAAKVEVARSQYLPIGDIAFELNRATNNAPPGTRFNVGTGLPYLIGPASRAFTSGFWNNVSAITLSWDVAHLTQKMALVDVALADRLGARAGVEAQKLNIAFGAADAFIAVVEAQERLKAARAALERARTFAKIVDAAVRSDLRPGADASRAAAEAAVADTELARAEETEKLNETQLVEALGATGQSPRVIPGRLLEQPASTAGPRDISPRNPLIRQVSAKINAAEHRAHAAVLDYIPRLDIGAVLLGYGSGSFPGGFRLGSAQGVLPDTPNWGISAIVTIPILQYPEIRARADVAAAEVKRAIAQHDEVVQEVRTQIDTARAILDYARPVARDTHVSFESSRITLRQAEARYSAGLYNIDPVAEALRLLAQTESDNAVAIVDIWRAKLLLARAIGDLGPLLEEVSTASAR